MNAVPEFRVPVEEALESAAERQRSSPSARAIPWPLIWTCVVCALLVWGWNAQLDRYITPDRGLGYALGITGGSMMLLLLVYSARKRARWLAWMGGVPKWFQIHMVLGVCGPLLVLFHTNFRLGATNSNVALICMLLVAMSGVIGRYIYTRMHAELDGRSYTFAQLQTAARSLHEQASDWEAVPALLQWLERAESQLLAGPQGARWGLMTVLMSPWRALQLRLQLRRIMSEAQAGLDRGSDADPLETLKRSQELHRYAERRLDLARRVAEYRMYARLFSFWHILHIPLFFMLLLAAFAHVIAVNIY